MNEHQLHYTELQLAIKAALIEMGNVLDPSPDVLLAAEQQQFLLYVQYRESSEAPVTLADTHLINKYLSAREVETGDEAEAEAAEGSRGPEEQSQETVADTLTEPVSGDTNADAGSDASMTGDDLGPDDVPSVGEAQQPSDKTLEAPEKSEESTEEYTEESTEESTEGGTESDDTKEGD